MRVFRFIVVLALAVIPVSAGTLDTTTFVVIGDGLAAGASGVGLSAQLQTKSFAAQIAGQLRTAFPKSVFQAPGLGDIPGEPSLPVVVPGYPQTTVRAQFPPTLFVFNLAVPGFKLADALRRRPALPLIRTNDWTQTMTNLILGYPALILDAEVPLWSQVEYVVAMNPTLVLVQLGYYDAIEAAVAGDPALMAEESAFRADYEEVIKRLGATFATVIVTTVPDPTRTAYFCSISKAAERLRLPAATLTERYHLASSDLLSESAIRDISGQLLFGEFQPLAPGRVLPDGIAVKIRDRVHAWNAEIAAVASREGAVVYDLASLFDRVRLQGAELGARKITTEAFGGFFGLDGFHPGAAGHALISNEIIALLNSRFGETIPVIDVNRVLSDDPVYQYRDVGGIQ